MTSLPAPVNTAAQNIDSIIHIAVVNVALGAAEAALKAALPVLSWPVMSQVFDLTMEFIFGYIATALEQAAAFAVIDGQIAQEQAAYQQALVKLSTVVQGDDNAATKAALTDYQNALAALIHFDGAAAT